MGSSNVGVLYEVLCNCLDKIGVPVALTNLDLLEEWFPENLHCTLYRGKLEMDRDLLFQAYSAFGKVRDFFTYNRDD